MRSPGLAVLISAGGILVHNAEASTLSTVPVLAFGRISRDERMKGQLASLEVHVKELEARLSVWELGEKNRLEALEREVRGLQERLRASETLLEAVRGDVDVWWEEWEKRLGDKEHARRAELGESREEGGKVVEEGASLSRSSIAPVLSGAILVDFVLRILFALRTAFSELCRILSEILNLISHRLAGERDSLL